MKRGLVLVLLAACSEPPPPPGTAGPVEAVQEFAEAVRKGDAATAWLLLSSRTQVQADELASAARQLSDAGPDSGRQMLFSSALPGRALQAKKISRSGDSAEVQAVEGDAGVRTWRVIREGGRWRIDLDLRR